FRYGEGQSRHRGIVEEHGGAGQRSETNNPRRQATWALRGARDRHLQAQDQGADAPGSPRQISCGMGESRKRLEARSRYLERRQVGHPSLRCSRPVCECGFSSPTTGGENMTVYVIADIKVTDDGWDT